MKNLFVCSTQYQLLNAANIAGLVFPDDVNEVAIIGCIPQIGEKLKQIASTLDCFSHMHWINTGRVNGSKASYVRSAIALLFPETLGIRPLKADRVLIVATEVYSRIIASYMIRYKKASELYYFEEGVGSYAGIISQQAIYSKSNQRIKLRFGFYLADHCKGMYVYHPSLMGDNPLNIPILNIPTVQVNSIWAKSLYTKFNLDGDNSPRLFPNDVLYFGTHFNVGADNSAALHQIDILHSALGDRLVIKPHPSDQDALNDQKIRILKSKMSFETFNLIQSFENNVLIAHNSTATLSPKLIFDEEPVIILLYKISGSTMSADYERFFAGIKAIYRNQERFWIPESTEELLSILKKLTATKDE